MIKKDCFYLQFDLCQCTSTEQFTKEKKIPIHSITRCRKHICKTNKKKSKNNVNKN